MSAADGEQGRVAAVFGADTEVGATLPRWTGRPPRSVLRGSGRRACRRRSSILLSSRFPMWMAWGPDLTLLLQRRLSPRHPGPQVSVGAGPARE